MVSKDDLFIIIFGWFLCVFSWVACAPALTYFFIKLYRQRNRIMIYKRYPITTLTTYIIVMIDIVIQKPFFIIFQVGPVTPATSAVLFTSLAFFPLTYYGFIYAILWKFYLLFYEINYSKESMNDGWKNIINHETSETKSFFLEHHDTLGNFHWFTKRLTITSAISIGISYIFWVLGCINWYYIDIEDGEGYGGFKYMRVASGIDLFLVSFPLLFMVYMYFRIPAFYDYFSVRDELKLTFGVIAINYIAIVFVQIEVVWLHLFGVYTTNSRIYSMIHTTVTIICQCAVILIQTSWTLSKLDPYLGIRWNRTKSKINMQDMVIKASEHDDMNAQDQQTQLNTRKNSKVTRGAKGSLNLKKNLSESGPNEANITLHDILCRQTTFDAFMLHIVKEFSVELLLSYVEFTQLLQYLFEHYDEYISKEVHDDEVNMTLIEFPDGVPQSYIIKTATQSIINDQLSRGRSRDESEAMEIHKKSKQDVLTMVLFIGSSLYNKYVKKNADLEINISSALRKKFIQMFTGYNNKEEELELDLNQVIQLFVDANKAMFKLLGYSLSRFKSKKDFERLLESSRSTAKSATGAMDEVKGAIDEMKNKVRG
eukprot:439928_1